jgi:hypothetical protein
MIQAFTDLVGTSAVPALSINIEELTELTPALDTAMAAHDTADQASEAAATAVAFVWPNGC